MTRAQIGSDLGNVGGIVSGAMSGTPTGYASAAINAGQLAGNHGAFGSNASGASRALGSASNVLGIYNGIRQGGVAGDTGAAANAAQLGARFGAFGGASGMVGSLAGDVAAPLAVYNFAKNYQSGNTASDTINGAETGAAIGSVVPVIGTAVGAIGGALVGALSSAFGGGENDPETLGWNQTVKAASSNPSVLQSENPSQLYQNLAGMMDAKNNTAGHSTALELTFGRMGEGNLMDQMTAQVNNAIKANPALASDSASQLYNAVVTPWLQQKGGYVSPTAIVSSNGTRAGDSVNNMLTGLLGDWMNGSLNAGSRVGVAGQTISGLPTFAGSSIGGGIQSPPQAVGAQGPY